MPLDLMIYVEDPGAANLTLGVPASLRREGRHAAIFASGAARAYLSAVGQEFSDYADHPDILDQQQPAIIAIGTSEQVDSPARTLLSDARRRRIPSVGLVDAPANAALRFAGRSPGAAREFPDCLIVIDEQTQAAYREIGFPGSIRIAENPRIEQARRKGREFTADARRALRRQLIADVDRPMIVFLSELSTGLDPRDFMRSADYSLQGYGGSDSRTIIVFEEFLNAVAALDLRPATILRIHPKDRVEDYTPYLSRMAGVSQGGDALDVCLCSDLVIGMTTSLLSECRHAGQRVLSILPRPSERAWLSDLTNGAIPSVWQRDAIAPAIRDLLAAPAGNPTSVSQTTMSAVLLSMLTSLKHPA